jgi:hypothetical protein
MSCWEWPNNMSQLMRTVPSSGREMNCMRPNQLVMGGPKALETRSRVTFVVSYEIQPISHEREFTPAPPMENSHPSSPSAEPQECPRRAPAADEDAREHGEHDALRPGRPAVLLRL